MVAPWVKLLVLAGAVLLVWAHGRSTGADRVQARWDASELQRERQTKIHEAQLRRTAQNAGMGYERERTALRAHAESAEDRAELLASLQVPMCPSTGETHAPQLADLRVPAAAVDRLRRAAGPDAGD